jgi:hypothetical protein
VPEAGAKRQKGSKVMQSFVELKTEETKAVVGGIMAKRGGGPLERLETLIVDVIRALDPDRMRMNVKA